MKIKSIKVIKGKNKWSDSKEKLIHMVLDLGEYEQKPSNKIDGFYERIKKHLPSLKSHRCSIGKPGGFFQRIKEGTWMGHIIEHVALELQTLAGYDTGWGRTRGVKGQKGVYNVVFNFENEECGKLAAKEAFNVVNDIINDKDPQIDKIVKKLESKTLIESIRRILREEDFIPLEDLNTVIKDYEDGFDVFIMNGDKKIGEISFAKEDKPDQYTIVDATIDDEYKGNRIYPKTIINLFKERPNLIINSVFRSPDAEKAWIYLLSDLPSNIEHKVKYYEDEETTLYQLKLKNLQESIRRIVKEVRVPRNERVELYKDNNIIVVVPLTHRALKKYANQCQWCINSDLDEWEDYHKGKHAVIIQRNPKKPKMGITGHPTASEIFFLAKWDNGESDFDDICQILDYEFRNDRTMADYYTTISNDINNFGTNIVYYSPENGVYDQEDNFLWNFNYEISDIPNVTPEVIKIMDNYLQEEEEMNLQENIKRILREETEVPLFIKRRFNHKDLDQLINDVEDAILRYGDDKHIDDAIYDEVRGFITEFVDYEDWYNMNDDKYWDTWLKYETPLVNYVKTKLKL